MNGVPLNDELWRAVEARLDAREDPREDVDVRRALERDPAARAVVEELTRMLDLLAAAGTHERVASHTSREPESPAAPTTTPWRPARLTAWAAGLAAVLGAGLWSTGENVPQSTPRPTATFDVSLVVETEAHTPSERAAARLGSQRIVTWTLEPR